MLTVVNVANHLSISPSTIHSYDNQRYTVSEEQMNEIKDITHNLETESEDLRKKREIAELILKKNKKDNNYFIRTPNEIEKSLSMMINMNDSSYPQKKMTT